MRWPRALAGVLLALAALLGVRASPAVAAPLTGVGEQNPQIFSDPAWRLLELHDTRLVVSWDAARISWEREQIDAYMRAAEAGGVRVLVAFGRSRDPRRVKLLPSRARYRAAFAAFRKRWPSPTDFVAWNEANHCSQPTCHKPERAAGYFDTLRSACRACRIVAADVLDSTTMVPWLRAFRAAARHKPTIWGLHNYIDANRLTTRGTRAMLRAVRGEVWFTETGGVVSRSSTSPITFPQNKRHAAVAMQFLFSRLVRLSPRIGRVYVYHWRPAAGAGATWDSALVDRRGKPRPAYKVVLAWLRAVRTAAPAFGK